MIELVKESVLRDRSRRVVQRLSADISETVPGARVEEIGSTAIPGSITKGDVDLLVLVDEKCFGEARDALGRIYETNEMEAIELFASFKGCLNDIEFGIQLSTASASNFQFIEFRDKLRRTPDLVEQYNEIKRKAAALQMDEYRSRKYEFIRSVLETEA